MMASNNCWRCLLRPSIASPSPSLTRHSVSLAMTTTMPTTMTPTPTITSTFPATAHAFSTTSAPYAVFVKGRMGGTKSTGKSGGGHQRLGKRMKLSKHKKDRSQERGKTPGPGERKAFRKRIVLSNNNAVPVNNLSPMTASNLADPESAGKVLKIPESTTDQLRASEVFRASQSWGLFYSPHTLVRPETVTMCQRMLEAAKEGNTARLVISGDRAAGKSMVLLQAVANAFLNQWVVIHIPEARDVVSASTEYAPIPETSPVQWMQSVYALALMRKILTANRAVLDKIYTTQSYESFTNPVVEGADLITLIESAREPDQAWPVFTALRHELLAVKADNYGTPRPPILLALDGLGWAMMDSEYRSQSFDLIHSHDLALVRMFVDVLAGKHPLPNGGAVVAATCRSNAPRNPSLELALEQHLARQAGAADLPARDPYCRKYDARVDEAMADPGIEVVNVKGISKAEARALMEYWAASGMLRSTVDETTVSEKWMTGGNGIIGEMERVGLMSLRV